MSRVDTIEMQKIIIELKNNNMDVFDEFYELTKRQVYVSILSIIKNKTISDDIMQETYLRFLNNIHKYKEKTNVVAFIVTIARNLAINAYNKQKREVFYDFSKYEDTYLDESSSDTPLLNLVYETLSGDELQVFILHTIDELKHKEIAKIMKKPLGTITWLYNKAVKKVKERIGEDNE
ncbi:MAG: RNA polymerase sigma factor [Bacilli bacterium]|nr:RNA polymerase sigma factor [Bacilli bacterium]MDY4051786.1 RNA polymerase sigma factor [Bacilli bacterium]